MRSGSVMGAVPGSATSTAASGSHREDYLRDMRLMKELAQR